jgi:hypothetical protein
LSNKIVCGYHYLVFPDKNRYWFMIVNRQGKILFNDSTTQGQIQVYDSTGKERYWFLIRQTMRDTGSLFDIQGQIILQTRTDTGS